MLLAGLSKLKTGPFKHGYILKHVFNVSELRLSALQLQHEQSGATHLHFARDDRNKNFAVLFKTLPTDSSGLPHILEHTTLCGSEKYPTRDPFFKMLRRSQATFMNAMTGSDLTVYPFSTMNDVDYKNLMSVYLDAVFRPKLDKYDFLQEGWRLEPTNMNDAKNSPLTFKGIVFNEMKGVYSNSAHRFAIEIQQRLLPKSYGNVSGGIPLAIPSLTWQNLRDFHKKHYSPSNAIFITYGDMDLESHLEFIASEYLIKAPKEQSVKPPQIEPSWTEKRAVQMTCPPDTMNPYPDRACMFSASYKMVNSEETYDAFKLSILSQLLISGENAPLYQELIVNSQLGLDWADSGVGFDSSTRSSTFHIALQGVRESDLDAIEAKIDQTLQQVKEHGFSDERIEGILHAYEIGLRHETAQFGFKLIYNLCSPLAHGSLGQLEEMLQVQARIDRFKQDYQANPKKFFTSLIDKYFLNNPHKLISVMRPDDKFVAEMDRKEAELLDTTVAKITSEDRDRIVAESEQLAKVQAEQSEKPDECTLPCLHLSDIPVECVSEAFHMINLVDGVSVQLNEASTNGLLYAHFLLPLDDLPADLVPLVPQFCELFTRLGAQGLDYRQFDQAQELATTGFSCQPHLRGYIDRDGLIEHLHTPKKWLHVSTSCLSRNISRMFELFARLFAEPDWDDAKRIRLLVEMSASSNWSADALSQSAHMIALQYASADLNPTEAHRNAWRGLEQAQLIISQVAKQVAQDQQLAHLMAQFKRIWQHVNTLRHGIRVSLHGSKDEFQLALPELQQFLGKLPTLAEEAQPDETAPTTMPESSDIGLLAKYVVMPYNVHYVASAIPGPNFLQESFASYRVLGSMLTSKYIHREIREKGGAYGARVSASSGKFTFTTYRDPNSDKSLETFNKALDWACNEAKFSEQDILEAKLSIFQDLDRPVSAGSRGLRAFLSGHTDPMVQAFRNHLFQVDLDSVTEAGQELIANRGKLQSDCILGPKVTMDRLLTDDKKTWLVQNF